MAGLKLININKTYPGGEHAVFDLDLTVRDNEFLVFLGPSGSGKTTALRLIAGLEEVTSGELYIGDKLVNDVSPKERDVAMVFPNSRLYPHMTVYENLAFGLSIRKLPQELIDMEVKAAAEILGMTDYLYRKPKSLTSAQRQRVALGRTIVRKPKVLLLNEPLSNLDAKLRIKMRAEISKLHARLGTTFVYGTHDPIEAMTLADRIVVMKDGFMQQADTPQNLYDYPVNVFVAGFIGTPQMNFFKGARLVGEEGKIFLTFLGGNKILLPETVAARIEALDLYKDRDRTVTLGVRPEDIHADESFLETSPNTAVIAKAEAVETLGSEMLVYCDLDYKAKSSVTDSPSQLVARIPSRAAVKVGQEIKFALDARHIHLFDSVTEQTLLARDAQYEEIAGCAEDAKFRPLTPQEMAARLERTRAALKETKRSARQKHGKKGEAEGSLEDGAEDTNE